MTHRSLLAILRSARLSPGLEHMGLARIERNIPRHCRQTLPRKTLSAVLLTVVLAGIFLVKSPLLRAQVSSDKAAQPRHRQAKPMVTGTDGTQTGTASFLGNFTQIIQPYTSLFLLQRQANCSLNLITGTVDTQNSPIALSITGNTPHYERFMHQLASLTTTPDVYPHGCAEKTTGVSSRLGVFVGMPQSGTLVSAIVAYDGNSNAVQTRIYTFPYTSATQNVTSSLPNASGLATADLNGDGSGDLVVVNAYDASSYISVMLGNPDGTFQEPVNYPAGGNYTVAAVIDDVNGDGNLDIVTVSGDQQISVLLGKGDGTFQPAQSFPAPALPGNANASSTPIVNLITADLRGIGKKDIICSNGLVLLGDGKGTFTPATGPAFSYYFDPISAEGPNLATGDIDNDGKIDLVLNNSSTISTWMGNGDGTFTQGVSYATVSDTGFLTVTDLDGDGNLDIYVGLSSGGLYSGDDLNDDMAYFLMGNGDGTFTGAPQIEVGAYTGNNLADVTGSGKLDLITNTVDTPYGYPDTLVSAFTVQLGNGKGLFNPVSTITPPASFVLGGGTFTGANTSPANAFAVGDLNGDGKADLAFVDDGLTGSAPNKNFLAFYFTALSNGDGTFAAPTPNAFPQIAPSNSFDIALDVPGIQIGNLKKSGPAALIFTFNETGEAVAGFDTYNQGIAVLPGNGNGTYGAPVITFTNSSNDANAINFSFGPQISAIVDLNGDGNLDLVVINNSYVAFVGAASQVEVFLGNGDGTFKAPIIVNTPANPTSLVLSDFNKDGKLDLAVVCGAINAQTDELAILLGNGDGTFGAPAIMTIASDINGGATLAAADFNADGNVDLAYFNAFGNGGIFYGNGDGTLTSVNTGAYVVPKDLINMPARGAAVAVDLNGDGKPDILVGNTVLLSLYGSAPNTNPGVNSTTGLVASTQAITVGASVTFTATVTGPSGNTTIPTGIVTFYNGASALGPGTLSASGVATYTTTTLPTGSDSISAVYAGDANFNGSTSAAVVVTVNAVVATTTALAASPTSALTGVSIGLTATVAPASGSVTPTGTVTFYDVATSIGTGTLNGSGVATLSTAALAVGSHSLTAQYGGSTAFAVSTSTAVTVSISAPPPDFSMNITPASGTETGSAPATGTVTVTPINSFTGTVNFACSGQPSYIACSFSPGALTPAGSAVTTTVTFAASANASAQPDAGARPAPLVCLVFGFGFLLLARAPKYRHLFRATAVLLFVVAMVNIVACGSAKPKPQTSTVTITATSGTIAHTATYSLTSTK